MVTISINDNSILSKYKKWEIETKVSNFFKDEFWIDDELILYWMNAENVSDDIKNVYKEAKNIDNSEYINY